MLNEMRKIDNVWFHSNVEYKYKWKTKVLINEHTKPNKNRHVDIKDRIVVTRGEGVGQRVKWLNGIDYLVIDRK